MAGEGEKLLSGGTEIGAAMALKSLIVIVGLAALTLLGEAAQSSSSAQTATSGPAARSARLSFPKILSARFRAMKQNQCMIASDVCHAPSTWDGCGQPVQVAAPA
jgi:hypothetical protein